VAFQNSGGGSSFPLTVTGNSVNAVKVQTSSLNNIFNIDTITPQVNITDGNLIMSGTETLNKLQIDGTSTNQQLSYSNLASLPVPFASDCDSLLTIKRNPTIPDVNLAGLSIENTTNKLFLGCDDTVSAIYTPKSLGCILPNGTFAITVDSSERPPQKQDVQISNNTPTGNIEFRKARGGTGNYTFSDAVPIIDASLVSPELLPVLPNSLTTKAYVDSAITNISFKMKSILSTPSVNSGDIFPLVVPDNTNTFGSNSINLSKSGIVLLAKFSGSLTHVSTQPVSFSLIDRINPKTYGSVIFANVPFNGIGNYTTEVTLILGSIIVPSAVPSKVSYTFSYQNFIQTIVQSIVVDVTVPVIELGCNSNSGLGGLINTEQITVQLA
jgi:hypothetical protein